MLQPPAPLVAYFYAATLAGKDSAVDTLHAFT